MTVPATPSVDRKLVPLAPGTAEWSWNVVTGEVTWSEGIEEALFGLPRGKFAGTFEAYLALVHPDDRSYFQGVIARTLAGEDEYVMSHRVVWPDGSTRWIDGRGTLTRDAEGRPLVLRGMSWSAAARKVAELRHSHLHRVQAVTRAVSRELLRVEREEDAFDLACRIAVEHGHFRFAWVGIVNAAGRAEPVARAGIDDGYLDEPHVVEGRMREADGPLGRALRGGEAWIVNDIQTDPVFAPWREEATRRGYAGCGAFPLRRRGGTTVGALVIYASEANRFDDDQVELLRALADDMSFKLDALDAAHRQNEAEEALRRSEERYRAVVEQANDAIFLTDPTGIVLEANSAATQHMMCTREQLIGRRVSDVLVSPEEPIARRLQGMPPGTRVTAEQTMRRHDGSILIADVSAVKLADGRVLGFSRDITEKKNVQRQLVLADRLASLGRLAAGVAHEINNPLAYTMLSLERIGRAVRDDVPSAADLLEIRAAAVDARDGAERVRSIVRSLGAFSREEDRDVGAVDLCHVLENAVRMSESAVRHRGRILMNCTSTRRVRGSELRLGQVFVNLLVNAADALPDESEEGRVEVRSFDEGDKVVVEVGDNGLGILPEHIERVFEPFFTTKPVGEGTGLGLAISHGIVTGFGGKITVESKVGRGTTFRVSLVADVGEAPAPRESREREKKGVSVLIVDDEPRLAQALALLLENHSVTVATSGREALEKIRSHTYDVILCDLMMAGVSGMDLHAELARKGGGEERRMIFMTGGVCTTRARDFLSHSSSMLLEKPFGPGRVEEAIANLVESQGRV